MAEAYIESLFQEEIERIEKGFNPSETVEVHYISNYDKESMYPLFTGLIEKPSEKEVNDLYDYLQRRNFPVTMERDDLDYVHVKPYPIREDKWYWAGTDSKGKNKFKHYTNQDLFAVTDFLDSKNINYIIGDSSTTVNIYSYADKFQYFYTTGKWSVYKKRPSNYKKKYYHSKNIEDFYERFFLKTLEREKKYFKELFINPRYEYDSKREDFPYLRLYIYLLYLFSSKPTPFLTIEKLEWIQDEPLYSIYNRYRNKRK
jgi:hypothetical protein